MKFGRATCKMLALKCLHTFKETLSVLLCMPNKRLWPFLYYNELYKNGRLQAFSCFVHFLSWHKLRKVYWICQVVIDSQIEKPQCGHPKRAELPDVNINTGVQSINTVECLWSIIIMLGLRLYDLNWPVDNPLKLQSVFVRTKDITALAIYLMILQSPVLYILDATP